MSEKKDAEDCPSEEASSQGESYDANKSGTSETYDMKDFCPGIRIEAKDFDGKWYPAKVSDVDWTENEILVHFENWNTKFDEWIPMDSSRLRSLQKPSIPHSRKEHVKFSKGEEVMAMWSPYQKYPATIQAVLPNDRYDVLFYDGFLKRLKSHKISKVEGETVKTEVRNFTDIGTKEERRERKRKINVAELFHVNKRTKKKGLVHSKTQDIKTYPVTKSKNRSSVLKKPISSGEGSENVSGVESGDVKPKQEKPLSSGPSVSTKALVDTIPAAFEVKYINGQTEMWSKQLYQRSEGRTAGKLDIVILNPQGRKFRSRNEIMKYCEENGIVYSHEAFDFSAKGRPKSKPNIQSSTSKLDSSAEDKDKLKKSQRRSQMDVSVPPTPILPQPAAVTLSEVLPTSETDPNQNKVFIGDYEVVIENGKFICPVKTCGKHFRRENLLHMHMKHYHPEFSKYLDYTPSVTDLAYARTVGGLDATEVSSPAPRKSEKSEKSSSKVENVRRASETSFEYNKDAKKMKMSETRSESKVYPIKGLSELPSTESGDNMLEETQKSGSAHGKTMANANESPYKNESSLERTASSIDNKLNESTVPESKGSTSSHSVMKSLRHKLSSRKKASRFQGSFAEHMRKKRLISQDHSKSQSRLNRQHQTQHLRHQLQQPPLQLPSLASQSCVDDVSATGQSHALPRYPKPQMTITNEIPGKNHLLTSSFSPGKAKSEHESVKELNRRSFLAGLIRMKRRATMTYRMRKKRKKAMMRRVRSSEFIKETNAAGLQPKEIIQQNGVRSENEKETPIVKEESQSDTKQGIRLKLKRVDSHASKWIKSDSDNCNEFVCLNGGTKVDQVQKPGEIFIKTEDFNVSKCTKAYEGASESPHENRNGEIDVNSMPKSYVLLENIYENDAYDTYLNRSNGVSNGKSRRSSRPNSSRTRTQNRRRVPAKKVRFEKTVLEKWIPMDEVQEGSSPREGGEGRRDERKRKPTRGFSLDDPIRERETIVQVHGSDVIAKDQSLPQIKSGLDGIEGAEDSKVGLVEDGKIEKLRRNEIINCLCGITEEDGLMIQCDLCLCWQHGHCAGIFRESDVPDKYTCAICKNPYRARSSMKYLHDQEWLKEGTLPSLTFRSKREDVINQRKTILKRSHDLSGSIALLARVIHSLRLKVNIAEKKDHPKLWLWAKKWTEKKPNRLKEESEVKEEKPEVNVDVTNGVKKEGESQEDEKQLPKAPEPEAPIDSAECKLNLLDHLIHYQTLVDARLSCVESLVAELESMQDDAVNDEAPDRYPRTKATVQMLLRDLNTMKKIALI